MNYLTIPLNPEHNKRDFSCGKLMLDNYIRFQAGQDMRKKLSACFVLEDEASGKIKGYFTLSNSSIPLHYLPDQYKKNIPQSYKSIPAILLGRLAVSGEFQGNGLGGVLLIDALKRCLEISSKLGSFAVIVDPLDDVAENFYFKYGFIKLPDSGKMFLPMRTIAIQFEK
jgi:GNAT superfamily N-acetyltransferase